jgi:hypothetical protein
MLEEGSGRSRNKMKTRQSNYPCRDSLPFANVMDI